MYRVKDCRTFRPMTFGICDQLTAKTDRVQSYVSAFVLRAGIIDGEVRELSVFSQHHGIVG